MKKIFFPLLVLVLVSLVFCVGCIDWILPEGNQTKPVDQETIIEEYEELRGEWRDEEEFKLHYSVDSPYVKSLASSYHDYPGTFSLGYAFLDGKEKYIVGTPSSTGALFKEGEDMVSCSEPTTGSVSCREVTSSDQDMEEAVKAINGTLFPWFSLGEGFNITWEGEKEIEDRECVEYKIEIEANTLKADENLNLFDFYFSQSYYSSAGQASDEMLWRDGKSVYTMCVDKEYGFPVETKLEVEKSSFSSLGGSGTVSYYHATLDSFSSEVSEEEMTPPVEPTSYPSSSPGTETSVEQSQAYWEATTPLAIVDYSISGTDADLVLENKGLDQLNISAITLDGTDMGFSETTITGGEQVTVNGTSPQCTTGDQFSFEVTLTYDDLDTGITGKTFIGTTDLKGQCA